MQDNKVSFQVHTKDSASLACQVPLFVFFVFFFPLSSTRGQGIFMQAKPAEVSACLCKEKNSDVSAVFYTNLEKISKNILELVMEYHFLSTSQNCCVEPYINEQACVL